MKKTLKDLIKKLDVIDIYGTSDGDIESIEFDSRKVGNNSMFVALAGVETDGHGFIADAVGKGAAVVVVEKIPEDSIGNATYVVTPDTHKALGIMASEFYDNPSDKLKLVGVTGTNGKTTTATLLYETFKKLGYAVGLISTVVYKIVDREIESSHTTPDPIRLNQMLSEMVRTGCEYCFMEVSSHSIVQKRIEGLKFTGGIFTNITHEHLDYHKTFAEYIKAKKIFFDLLPKNAFALTNTDDKNGIVMIQNSKAATYTYGLKNNADYKAKVIEKLFDGMLLSIDNVDVWVKFTGGFNAYNLLAVYGASILLGADKNEILRILSGLDSVSGRFESIRSTDGITAIVDYAHTPDALENVISAINDIRTGGQKLITVVGCGGNRDKTKRPVMAGIASRNSDISIFTSDNPRMEDPAVILSEMETGVEKSSKYLIIQDRREAIKTAAMMAAKGDVILIAGKGHEDYQIIGKEKHHFDDREEIRKIWNLEYN
ncbi:MAG: UDP-N-acetylmuramoyl-L-alanyl-D-glutamate--2,6-diaminopimelate ligase [Rikenellaceae bacterium]|nr:UDP-N-acetylmuramoyl-L-alanyl-D-glutamate--2,6-diaminopimelate ligase [Rikenellaceae bacterium]